MPCIFSNHVYIVYCISYTINMYKYTVRIISQLMDKYKIFNIKYHNNNVYGNSSNNNLMFQKNIKYYVISMDLQFIHELLDTNNYKDDNY